MLPRLVLTYLLFMLSVVLTHPVVAQARGPVVPSDGIAARMATLRESAIARDSLSAIADTTSGTTRDFIDELIAQRDDDVRAGVIAVVERIKAEQRRGADVSAARRLVAEWLGEDWPRYEAQLKWRTQAILALSRSSDLATGSERVAIEARIGQQTERLLRAYQFLVDEVLALEPVGIDASEPRRFLVEGLPSMAHRMVTRVQLADRAQAFALARLSRDASSADLQYGLEAADERLKLTSQTLWGAILLMDRLHLETKDLRVAFINATGKLTADIFRWHVLLGVMRAQGAQLLDFLALRAARWLFQAGLIIVTFLAFRALSRLARYVARRAVGYSQISGLMRSTIVDLSGGAVMLVGLVVILTQLGVQLAPLLAGFGVAGVVIGFAMQSTLSNFAAGGMILGNRPFDLGDDIEVAGISGVVKDMNLVSTTILSGDNQTIIVPNSKIWGGVILNRTTQPHRRVDMTFAIGYGDDVERAERVLGEIVAGQEDVLREPVPVIRLHQLADSSVNFVVRVWTTKLRYWEVYWGLTRAVKLRFDQEGITIPFPQREVHLRVDKGASEAGLAALGPRADS